MSATPLAVVADAPTDASPETTSPEAVEPADVGSAVRTDGLPAKSGNAEETGPHSGPYDHQDVSSIQATLELVVVDTSAENYQQLIDDIVNNADETRGIQVFAFESDRDGIEQITELLSDYSEVDALHVVSHGSEGNVRLGSTTLNMGNLAAYAGQLGAWGDALTNDGDLLIYGCDLASSAVGKDFVEALSILTGADVAASDDDTGHALFGGDWILEYSTGAIEADVAFSMDVQQNWFSLLATTETHYFLRGGGIPEATLDTALPTATAIPDYDNGRHAPVGTLVDKGGSGFGESDPVKHQLWETASGSIDIDGPVQMKIWTHIKDFNTSKGATVHAYLIDIRNNGSDPQLVASDTVSRGTWNPNGDWVEDTFDFGSITRSLAANRRLQVKVVVDSSSDDGMVFGYDSIFHRSHLIVGMTTSNGDPVLTMGGSPLNYSEGDGVKEIDGGLSLSDDDTNQQWASVKITGNFQSAEDSLSYTDSLFGTTMKYDASSGEMVFYGATATSNYQDILRKVRYENTSEDPSELTRTVTFQIYDGQNLSTDTQTINVTGVNDDPTVNPTATATGLEDQNLVYTHAQMLSLIGAGDVDDTNADLTVNITGVTNATFNKAGSGNGTTYTFTLTQPAHANGFDVTFSYDVVDPDLASASGGPATITIQPVNDEPGLTIGSDQNVNEDTGLNTVNGFALATPGGGADESGQTFTYTVNNNNGSLFSVAPAIDGSGNLTYTLAADAFGTATVTVSVRDSGGTANGGDNESPSQQFDINVANSNNDDAFVAINNGLTINENATKAITATELRVDDADFPAASTLTYTVTSSPTLGQLELTTAPTVAITSFTQDDIDTGKLVYVHYGAEAPLADSFDFTATDGIGSPTAGQTFNIVINPQNDAPLNSLPATQNTLVDTPLVLSSSTGNQISVSDDDAGGANVEVTLNVTNGTVTVDLPYSAATPIATEDVVPSNTGQSQAEPSIARAANGDYVVVWSGKGPGDADGVYFQRFDANHIAQGGQVRANTTTANVQNQPRVALDDTGNFVVVWTSDLQDGDGRGVYLRRFDNTGSPTTGEIQVNTFTINAQDEPDIAMDADGDFVVVWQSNGQDGHSDGVYAQRFNASAAKVGGEFQVNTITDFKQYRAKAAMDAAGNFVVVWEDSKADGGQPGIFGRRYDNTGSALDATEFLVNSSSTKKQEFPDVAMDAVGNFVVVWDSQEQDTPTSRGVYGQLFDAAGNPVGPGEFLVNTTVVNEQRDVAVSMDADGDFVVVWESTNQDNPGDFLNGIYVQQFDSTGTKVGTEQLVNTTVTGDQSEPDVAMDGDGDFVVVWEGNGAGDADGVFAQQYTLPPPPLTFSSGDGINDNFTRFQGSIADINTALDGMVFTPTTSFIGTATINVDVNDLGNTGPGGAKSDNDNLSIDVTSGANNAPTITAISDLSVDEETSTAPIAFTVGDVETPVGSLIVTAVSSDTLKIPNGNLVLNDLGGGNWTIAATGALDQIGGPVTITVTVDDGTDTTDEVFDITIDNLNDAPTGSVNITGTPAEDQLLTASNTLADVDGLGTISYQWKRNGSDITGETSTTYTLVDADVGTTITVEASYTDGQGTPEAVLSAGVGPIAAVNDPPGGSVNISGTPTEDQVLTASNTLTDADGLGPISYQWQRNGIDITGETGTTYTLDDMDVGQNIRVVASYTDGQGFNESVNSAPVGPIAAVNDTPGGGVNISGVATEDQVLTASNTLTDDDGLGPISYQWQRNGIDITGETGTTYTLEDIDVGQNIRVVASYTDGQGFNESGNSAPVGPIANVNDAPGGTVNISGSPSVGSLLSASNTLTDDDGLGPISYQWKRSGLNILGATSSTYTLTALDLAQLITVEASYTDGHGTGESVLSAPVGPVTLFNNPPTGSVTISGTVAEDQVLTAANTLADPDGMGPISYQWQRGGVDIGGATATTYTLTDADVGQLINVVASYTDGGGTPESVSSGTVGPVTNVNDAPGGSVTISGTPTEDQLLTAANTLTDADGMGTVSYQWQRNGVDITGATASTYLLGDADSGQMIRVVASYTDGHGTAESVASAAVGPIANLNDLPTGNVTISGVPTEDMVLTASNTLADNDGMGIVSYQWKRDGSNITGATGTTYTLTDADVGTNITVAGNYIDGQGTAESVLSLPVGPIANVNDVPGGAVNISGSPSEGSLLSASNTITDDDGLGPITYQWKRNGSDITGATSSTYLLVPADVGTLISVEATYTDAHGTNETVLSTAVGPVTNVNTPPTGTVTISGVAAEDQILTAANTLADADGLGPISYQWQRNGVDITGATSTTYTLGDADVGTLITVEASYTDGGGTNESVLSAAVGPIANVNDDPTITAISDVIILEEGSTGPLAFTVSDIETTAGLLTVTATSSDTSLIPNAGIILNDLGGGNWTIAATGALNQHGGPVTITVSVNDGTATVSETFDVAITPVNDAPTIAAVTAQNINEDAAVGTTLVTVSAADVDTGDTLTSRSRAATPTQPSPFLPPEQSVWPIRSTSPPRRCTC